VGCEGKPVGPYGSLAVSVDEILVHGFKTRHAWMLKYIGGLRVYDKAYRGI